jgi:hypothetical protein
MLMHMLDAAAEGPEKRFAPMTAYRAWAGWTALIDGGGYQVKHVAARRDVLSPESAVRVLCEVYARAVMEVALAMYFDRCDSRVDVEVMLQMVDAFGQEVAEEVYRRVAAVGPVVPYAGRAPSGVIVERGTYGAVDECAQRGTGEAVLGAGAEGSGDAATAGGAESGESDATR